MPTSPNTKHHYNPDVTSAVTQLDAPRHEFPLPVRLRSASPTHIPKVEPNTHLMDPHTNHLRAVRPPQGSRRALFQSARRQNPTTIRPDREMASIFQQPQEDELVERTPQGEYIMYAPQMNYTHMALSLGREADEEAEQEQQMIDLYGKSSAHWDVAAVEEEIKLALKSSLRKQVASLDEDKWMFQGETELGKK